MNWVSSMIWIRNYAHKLRNNYEFVLTLLETHAMLPIMIRKSESSSMLCIVYLVRDLTWLCIVSIFFFKWLSRIWKPTDWSQILWFSTLFIQSFVHDLIFFLFTSVCPIYLVGNFKLFINHYYIEFTKILKLVDCPLGGLYIWKVSWNILTVLSKWNSEFVFVCHHWFVYRNQLIWGSNIVPVAQLLLLFWIIILFTHIKISIST